MPALVAQSNTRPTNDQDVGPSLGPLVIQNAPDEDSAFTQSDRNPI